MAWVLDVAPSKTEFLSRTRSGNLVPVSCELPADLETPISVFLKLRDQGNAFLLESVEGGEKWGRYSFLGTEPALVFRARGHRVEIETPGAPPTEAVNGLRLASLGRGSRRGSVAFLPALDPIQQLLARHLDELAELHAHDDPAGHGVGGEPRHPAADERVIQFSIAS